MADPLRPHSLVDVVQGLIQAPDDAGDSPDTQLYGSQYVSETGAAADAWTTSTHSPTYLYDAADSKYGLATFS